MKNRFRKALIERTPVFGAWMQVGHPACAEIFGRLGFDWVCVDLEHGAIGLESTANIFRTIDAYGSVPLARLPRLDAIWIARTLDAGARGLIVPMVNSAEQAREAVRRAKYPPLGGRGYGYSRANLHGIDFESSIAEANEETALIVQVEHRDGIDAIDAILETPGVDGAFIGPLDLSGSYGKPGDLTCPEVTDALARFRRACEAHGKPAGMHVVRPANGSIAAALQDGYTMIALGVDAVFLAAGAQNALAEARALHSAARA